jgi:RND superfamily putative drug exporter
MMSSLALLVVRRRRAVITIWILLLIGAGTIGSSAFSVLSSNFGAGPGTESGRVTERLDDLATTGGEIAIIADGIDIDDPVVVASLAAGLERIAAIDGVIAVADPWSTGSDALRASDGRAALVVVTIIGGLDEDTEIELAQEISAVARDLDAPEVLVGGNVLVGEQFATASENDLLRGEAIALPIAFLAMIFLLGGLRAAGMPMLVALAGVVTSLAVLVAATLFGDVSIFATNVVNMLGLGLGIDYGLLMVSRFREERGRGRDLHDAVVQTVATAGKTVVFSALTVAVAMCGLFVFGLPILSSFGVAGLGVVLLCMTAAVTLLPATLAAVGGKIPPTAPVADVEGRFYRLTRWVQGHAVAVGAGAVIVLVLLGVPFMNAQFEIGDARTLPRSSEVRDVALTLADRFPSRGTDPVTVIADSEQDSAEFLVWYEQLSTTSGVVGTAIRSNATAGAAIFAASHTRTLHGAVATLLLLGLR